ncbi:MAG: glycoside hydrolase family 13 protein [Lachnospiraceae bacterium]|nr:glycoside hydrolase family 13 protein [Lachnospiraceae bacterium]
MLPFSISGLSRTEKKLIYIHSMKPILNKALLYSDCTEWYVSPAEPEPHSDVTIRFRTGVADVDQVLFCDYETEREMTLAESTGDFDFYEIKIHLTDQKIRYFFKVKSGFEMCIYNRFGAVDKHSDDFAFAIMPGFSTPDWAKGAVMYQIFVDRFCDGDKSNNVLTNEYSYIDDNVTEVQDWYKYPATMGVREFYGGDLQGVMNKLDYLEKLGIEVIYFNPLFVSPSNHKYDIQDYDYIDPHYGKIVEDEGELLHDGDRNNKNATRYINRVTNKKNLEASNELFAKLVEEAHKRGIRVIIDGVFNHSGSFNKWLDRERIYENQEGYDKGAFITEDSPYHSFYRFHENRPEKWPYNTSYDGWWAHDTLPKLNYERSPKLEEYILQVAKKWVSPPYNVDGWRLDVAADLGHSPEYNHEFWRKFRAAVKEANPNAIILAEHYGNPESWLQGDQWDTVMNYDAFMEPITWFLTGMQKHSDERREHMKGDSTGMLNALKYHMGKMLMPSVLVAMNQLSNHDHSRFLTRTNETVGRTASLGPEAANHGVSKAVMKEAVVMQMTWPGAPTLYYGDEAGLCGWTDPDNRRTYPWGREDLELLEFHRDIISIHKNNIALKRGSFVALLEEYNLFGYGRFCLDNILVTVINNDNVPRRARMRVTQTGIHSEDVVERIMLTCEESYNAGSVRVNITNGTLDVEMPAKSAAIFRRVVE